MTVKTNQLESLQGYTQRGIFGCASDELMEHDNTCICMSCLIEREDNDDEND